MIEILYFHGFASCGQSSKARYLQSFFNVTAPDLSTHPEEALQQLRKIIQSKGNEELILVGTSLGGWYADEMANEFDLNEVLINPLTNVNEMKQFLGTNTNFCTGETFKFTEDDLSFLQNYKRASYQGMQKVIWLSTNDQVLNPEYAKRYYEGKSGNHTFSNKEHRFDLEGTDIVKVINKIPNTFYL